MTYYLENLRFPPDLPEVEELVGAVAYVCSFASCARRKWPSRDKQLTAIRAFVSTLMKGSFWVGASTLERTMCSFDHV